ncbi:ABC transporter substrate-binding protein [Allostreptomyces psammosilenae]|uniref:Multiple sugar transport system substrate-binding protein n=1 Tax=Allostreptomyces psammosilenae TaxID=1892865 RepID=A0A852ZLA3_9ACTN|nr:extracellular solute-binding protein [Allostreptomyces psammosilenae]NYI03183.1 multiple sugar transport system substrate-binding protein [Allostreptomyces psammosilenae]
MRAPLLLPLRRRAPRVLLSALLWLLPVVAAGCAAPTDGPGLTVWSLESQTERMLATEEIVRRFREETGIPVHLVAVDEDQLSRMIMAGAAAGDLPDVIAALPLAQTHQLAGAGLLDTAAATAVVDRLGRGTFTPRALEMVAADPRAADGAAGGELIAVPSDGWTQLIVYRADLFAEAGLDPPTSYAALQEAARTLDGPDRAGIALATDPGSAFTAQSFEALALAAGCQLVDGAGRVALDSPACVDAFRLYGDLARRWSVPGVQTVDSTRAAYFSGQAAMVVWSSALLDELAGLRSDTLPSCPECRGDPGWLARNSGVVTALSGPDGAGPAQFGEVTSFALLHGTGQGADASSADARAFVEYMMSAGYPDWLAVAPEGKVPARTGDGADPRRYTDAWNALRAGVDVREPLADHYPAATLDALRSTVADMDRWGVPQGQGDLVGAAIGELPVARAVADLAQGGSDPAEAARRAAADVEALAESLR